MGWRRWPRVLFTRTCRTALCQRYVAMAAMPGESDLFPAPRTFRGPRGSELR